MKETVPSVEDVLFSTSKVVDFDGNFVVNMRASDIKKRRDSQYKKRPKTHTVYYK